MTIMTIGIVVSEFNYDITMMMLERAKAHAEFLDVEDHPVMSFGSSSVEAGEAAGTYRVTGTLSLHGVTKEITVDARLVGAGKTAFGDVRAGLEATFTVRRSEYAMQAMLDKLGDEVRFTLRLEGRHAG